MISRNFKTYDLNSFLKRFEKIFSRKGYKVLNKEKMTEKSFPDILVLTLSKDENLVRVSFVLDRNGITLTAVGVKDKNIEREIMELLDLL